MGLAPFRPHPSLPAVPDEADARKDVRALKLGGSAWFANEIV
jgi:hypothetical protein